MATYVFRDEKILRPYFSGLHAPGRVQVTRNHPPIPGVDPVDHDTMHPGIWLGFGDLNGHDFWRNKARILHLRFLERPSVRKGEITFATENALETLSGERLGAQTSRFTISARARGYLLIWDASFSSDKGDLVFGDQEEMGLGVRVATAIAEKRGGVIRTSSGGRGAAATWGKIAEWSDYSGTIGGLRAGILLMPDPGNFRPCWFHNRDYGLMVANPFGRSAFTGGEKSSVVVKKRETFRLRFGILLHAGETTEELDLAAEYQYFQRALAPR